jgi:carbamoylphosphate synthase large subunit
VEDAAQFAASVGYPVLVRPSFVLSGAAMNVAADREQVTHRSCGFERALEFTSFSINVAPTAFTTGRAAGDRIGAARAVSL